jgi:hypothetical protein
MQTPNVMEHKPLAHCSFAVHASVRPSLHTPAPSQTFASPVQAGSTVPWATFEHVPTRPVTLHAWQLSVQAVSQQTPSAQFPLAQVVPSAQV